MGTQLKKAAAITDIHWGRKNNSEQHNNDCAEFVEWFCGKVAADSTIDHVIFLGDWFENRKHVGVATLHRAYQAAERINALGIPVFFIVGNHDMLYREHREVFSTLHYNSLENFTIIDRPTVVPEIGNGGALIAPYLLHSEYDQLAEHLSLETWWGHFEFQGFVLTGSTVTMQHGPDASLFTGPKIIASGHFHKRQSKKNVVYIGNTFPMDFSDANDFDRGMMVYDHNTHKKHFINWGDAPSYVRVELSDVLDQKVDHMLRPKGRVVINLDVDLSYEDSLTLRSELVKQFHLREVQFETPSVGSDALSSTEIDQQTSDAITLAAATGSNDDLVIQMLNQINTDGIDSAVLIEQFKGLRG